MRRGQSVQSDLTDIGCMMRLRLIYFEIVDGSFPIFSAMERKVSCWLIPVWMSIRSSRVRCFCFFGMRYLLTKSLRLNSSIIRRLRVTSSFGREMEVTLRSYVSPILEGEDQYFFHDRTRLWYNKENKFFSKTKEKIDDLCRNSCRWNWHTYGNQ